MTGNLGSKLSPPGGQVGGGAFGCPHFTTFDGLAYDFQGAGEFIAAKSTVAGNNFQVQLRIEPEGSSDSSVSIITQIAVQVGNDHVTFAANRDNVVWVDGAAVAISQSSPVFSLKGGTITEVSSNDYQVVLNTGEVVTVNPFGDGMGFNIALAASDGAGSVQGLLGANEGQASDFQTPDGTILKQPLTQDELYQTFANAWRVTDATSLLDYDKGQTTATFTNAQYPRAILTLADLPPDLVAKAALLVAAAGITDPTLAAAAEFDYITMGNPSFILDDAAAAGAGGTGITPTTPAVITQHGAVAPSIGVLAAAPSIVEAASGTTPVTFYVNLTSAPTADTVVNWTVTPNVDYLATSSGQNNSGKTFFTAADFGGTAPSGAVTVKAGQTEAVITVDVPASALVGAPDKWLGVTVTSPSSLAIYDPTAQTEVVNSQPTAGTTPAQPSIELLTSGASIISQNTPTLTQSGNAYTLDLGEVLQSVSLPALQFAIANLAPMSGDALAAMISSITGAGFAASGAQPQNVIAAGGAFNELYFTPNATALGAQSTVMTLAAEDTNDSGYLGTLPDLTLTLKETVIAAAQGSASPAAITFANVRVGASETQAITVTNTAASGAANLDASASVTGSVTASGAVAGLAAGASDATDIVVALATTTAGAISGSATVDFASDLGPGVTVPALPSQTIAVSGKVYRTASATLGLPSHFVVHVGDTVAQALLVRNSAAKDGYSENLIATPISATGSVTASGTTGDIAAGALSGAITLSFSTTQAGAVSGAVTLDLQSDGTGVDGLGILDLGHRTVQVNATVDNYAVAAFEKVSGAGSFQGSGNAFTLDLGTVQVGGQALAASVGALNAATGVADLLQGTFAATTDAFASAFTNAGLAAFSALAAGQADTAPTVTFSAGKVGAFRETITLAATGSNASGYAGKLTPVTLTVSGDVTGAISVAYYLANTALVDPLGGLTIQDTAVNIQGALASLTTDDAIATIVATSGIVTVSVAVFTSDEAALDKVVGGFAIVDTVANVQSALAGLAADTRIATITATGGTLSVTVAAFTASKAALDKVVGGFAISDTVANVQKAVAALAADAAHITAITARGGTILASVAGLARNKASLDKIVGGFAVVDSAANVQAGLASLTADAAHITTISATSGTVAVNVAAFAANNTILDKLVSGFTIVDTVANVQGNLPALAADGHVTAITTTDGTLGASIAAFTASQVALDKIDGGFTIADTVANVQAALSSLAADTHITTITATGGTLNLTVATFTASKPALDKVVGGFGISDTASNVQGAIASLAADAALITAIAVTGGTLGVTVAAFAAGQAALDKVIGGFVIVDTVGSVQTALARLATDTKNIKAITATGGTVGVSIATFETAQALLDKVVGGFAISDTATSVQSALASLAADAAHITTIAVTGGTLNVTVAAFKADRAALDKIVGGFAISDSVANVQSALTSLAADAAHVQAMTVMGGTLSVTVATFKAVQAALDKIVGGFAISDTASNIQGALAGLSADAARIQAVAVASGTLSVTVAAFKASQTALDKVVGGFGISDTAANIQAALPLLAADALHITAIKTTSGTLAVNVAAFEAGLAALDKVVGGFIVTDTVANVQGALESLAADPRITAIKVTDGTPSLTVAAFKTGKAALDRLVGGFAIADSVANVQGALASLAADAGQITAITVTGGTVNVSAATFAADKAALDKIQGRFGVVDTAANLAKAGSSLQSDDHISSIATTSGGAVIARSTFNLDGTLYQAYHVTALPNGTVDYRYESGSYFNGKPFTAFDDVKTAGGVILRSTLYNGSTPTQQITFNSDGSIYLQASIRKLASGNLVYHYTSGSYFAGKAFASYSQAISPAGHLLSTSTYNAGGALLQQNEYNADGSLAYQETVRATTTAGQTDDHFQGGSYFADKPFSAYDQLLDSNGKLLMRETDNRDGSHTFTVPGSNLTLQAVQRDTFNVTGQNETIRFGAQGFGSDTFKGYAAGDTFSFAPSVFTGFANMVNHVSGTNSAIIKDAHGDSLTLTGVAPNTLNASMFEYV